MNILLWIVAALGVVCIVLAILYIVVRLRNSALAKDLRVTRNQKNNLIGENVHLQDDLDKARAQCDVTAQAFTELDSLHQKVVAERDELNRENESLHQANKSIVKQSSDLYKALQDAQKQLDGSRISVASLDAEKLLKTINDLMTENAELQQQLDHATIPLQEVAPEPVKRTRKKAGAQ